MRANVIDIKAESLPWQSKLLGVMFLFGALIALTDYNYWWLSISFAVMGLVLLSWHSGTEIDPVRRTFREYSSCLFIRAGATEKYNGVERVFITPSKISQTMYTAHTSHSSTFRYIIFNAYLKFDDGRKIFLTSRKDKLKLIKLLNRVVTALSVDLTDNTASALRE
jgi:hypothetical protein